MRIIAVKKAKKQKRHIGRRLLVVFLLLILATGTGNYLRPLPPVRATILANTQYPAAPINLKWPGFGQSAIATADMGVLATAGTQRPFATASIAKVITSLCILEKYPLAKGQSGPTISLTPADVAIYNDYISKDGSSVAVQPGEQLTEYQLLQGMLLPSANNLADTAAAWAYGSIESYSAYANTFLATHGLTDTHVGIDASGFDGSTTSTASDLAKLGTLALAQPAIADIVTQKTAILPLVGTVYNYNFALGQQGIFGIKTGNNDLDAGAFLFAAKIPIGSKTVTMTGAVMGASSLQNALESAVALLATTKNNFSELSVVHKNKVFVSYSSPWGAVNHAVASKDLSIVRWNAQTITSKTVLSNSGSAATFLGNRVGTLQVRLSTSNSDVALLIDHPLAKPSFWWRLTRH